MDYHPRITAGHSRRVLFPPWFRDFARPARYKTVYGGRSSSKTYTVSMWLILQAASRRCRIGCARQFQSSIDQSVKPSMEWAIHHLGLDHLFDVQAYGIKCRSTGSHIFFRGIERNIESIKGWHDLTHIWFEEAQTCKTEGMEVIIPTIMRGQAETEAWLTWNPRYRSDWVWQRFVERPRRGDIVKKISYADNPWHTAQSEMERRDAERHNPLRYGHIWEGNPDDGAGDTIILPYDWLQKCVEAYRRGLHEDASRWPAHGGLDIADGGADANCFVARRGPVIERWDKWHSTTPGYLMPAARRADRHMDRHDLERLYYDAGGVGAPIRADFHRLADEEARNYGTHPILFGGEVTGKRRIYWRKKTNADYFANRSSQLSFAVRARARNTVALLEGQDIDPDSCLFIDPAGGPRLRQFLADLSQPRWYDSPTSGKITVDKRGELKGDSPDAFDAAVLAFAKDSEAGLKR